MPAPTSDWLRHFRPLLCNRLMLIESKNSTSLTTLPSLSFSGRSKIKMATLASDCLKHFRLLLCFHWMNLMELDSKQELNILYQVCVSENQDGRPDMWLAGTYSTYSLQPLNRIQRNLVWSKIATSSAKFVCFRTDQHTKMAVLASD